ncbi:MAG: histidine kinase [Bacteroidota bacterium]|nr:histidine kinase [Bacteroidota bacterium]
MYSSSSGGFRWSGKLKGCLADSTYTHIFDFVAQTSSAGNNYLFGDLITTAGELVLPVFAFADRRDEQPAAMVVLNIPLSSINKIMLDSVAQNGLGQSGEAYLVGPDKMMRSKSRFFPNSVMNTAVKTTAVELALQGVTGTSIIQDYRGVEVLSSFGQFELPGINWAILAEIDSREATSSITEIRNSILMISTLITVMLFIYAFVASARFTLPVMKLKAATQKIGEGNFNPNLDIKSNDEIGDLVVSFRSMLSRLKEMTGELKKERFRRLRSVIDGQELERQRLSRELHDGLGQLLIALKLKLENTHGSDLCETKKAIKEVNESFDMTIEEIRRISNNLMPAVLNEFGIVNALRNLADEVQEHSGISVHFTSRNIDLNLNKKQKTYIYRIAQEALNNAVRHSKARDINMNIIQGDEFLTIRIEDNGKGFNYPEALREQGNGIHNMQERASIMNGKFEIRSEPGKGTLIIVNVPA